MAQRQTDLRSFRGAPSAPERPPGQRAPTLPPPPASPPAGPGRRRLKKLRVVLVLIGLALLAFVSWIFGIMMAVAQDLPQLENRQQYRHAQNSVILDRNGEPIATLTGNERRILVPSEEISQTVKQAVVAIEDQRFYAHRGVDWLGIGRALKDDILSGSAQQGASTITQQFVKNALRAQDSRTIFQKLRESALAYHLERQWSKDKILTEYLNSIYFGEGAYGIESAAETYFGSNHPDCGGEGDRCASQLLPEEAALLAGLISSPGAYSPQANPEAAKARRDLVLERMLEQGVLTQEQYEDAIESEIPAASEIDPPDEDSEAPYFTSWLRQQVVDRYGAGQAFGGGLEVRSTLDLELQRAVEEIASSKLAGIEPTASVVVLDNDTGGVLAMVGGNDFEEQPFNLATNGHRQPGSALKPFTLTTALEQGHSPSEVFTSQPKKIPFDPPGKVKSELFKVHNYEDSYLGSASLASATTYSDNSVYAELGLEVGTENIARTAREMGIQTKLSTNPAMILGGLEQGVTPLEMTYAYSTLARDGARIGGTMDSKPGADLGPVAIQRVEDPDGDLVEDNTGSDGENDVQTEQVLPPSVAGTAVDLLSSVVSSGTGKRAAVGDFAWGKTGTTDDNGDAWFCGGTEEITACVWVGHPTGTTPMETEFAGAPVDGGTYPAVIWHDVVLAVASILGSKDEEEDPSSTVPAGPAPAAPVEPAPDPEEPPPAESAPAEESAAPKRKRPAPAPKESAPPPASPAPGGGESTGEDSGGGESTGGGTESTDRAEG